MSLSRRQFLQGLALLSAGTMLSPVHRAFASGDPASFAPLRNAYSAYLTAMETPFTAPLNDHFDAIIGRNPVGLILYDLTHDHLLTALYPENPLPVASAFKAPMLMYFVDTISPDVWNSVPVAYWNANATSEVPDDYRESWQEHRFILRALWQALIMSDNSATGQVLSYVADVQGNPDALRLFNDWALNTVGVSQLSGLTAWSSGISNDHTFTDERYENRETALRSQLTQLDNMMTPRDLGLFYVWMLTHLSVDAQQVCRDLLSTIFNNRGANLERLAMTHNGTSYSKNGSLETDAGYVVSDAGIIELADVSYLLVIQSIDPVDEIINPVPTIFEELDKTLAGQYNEILHHHRSDAITGEELLAAYIAHLQTAYGEQTQSTTGNHSYGFILPEGVQVFSQPDETSPLHNPIIKSTRFGIHLLMQGALIRYVDVNADWVELVPDDDRDNVRVRLGLRTFLRRSDVWSVSHDYAEPIPYLVDETISQNDKFIVIDVVGRELTAFEGGTPVFRIPIVLNPDATPRGAQVITSKWYSRSMQAWAPGVPFTAFFGAEGFALHGSPWQRWTTTVNSENIYGRSSAGCVNVPFWMISSGDYNRPADELLFRWIGGMENTGETVFDYPTDNFPAIRIYSVDYLPNLVNYYRPDTLVTRDLSWDDIISAIDTVPVQAPDSFFI